MRPSRFCHGHAGVVSRRAGRPIATAADAFHPRVMAGGPGKYTIAQATSDRAQLNTIAFDGLAFLTGDFN